MGSGSKHKGVLHVTIIAARSEEGIDGLSLDTMEIGGLHICCAEEISHAGKVADTVGRDDIGVCD
jgi:hypothetical protein